MDLGHILGSFKGRITRGEWWAGMLIMVSLFGLMEGTLFAAGAERTSPLVRIPLFAVYVMAGWPFLAVAMKRFMDRDRLPWFAAPIYVLVLMVFTRQGFHADFVSLAAGIGALYMVIELGLIRGTIGSNQYGRDPTVYAAAA